MRAMVVVLRRPGRQELESFEVYARDKVAGSLTAKIHLLAKYGY